VKYADLFSQGAARGKRARERELAALITQFSST